MTTPSDGGTQAPATAPRDLPKVAADLTEAASSTASHLPERDPSADTAMAGDDQPGLDLPDNALEAAPARMEANDVVYVVDAQRARRRQVYASVFQTGVLQPTAHVTSAGPSTAPGQASDDLDLPDAGDVPAEDLDLPDADDDQSQFDWAWRVVTTQLALPPERVADVSDDAPLQSEAPVAVDDDFCVAAQLVVHANKHLPGATQTHDVFAWHLEQARSHYTAHVLPRVVACVDAAPCSHTRCIQAYDHAWSLLDESCSTIAKALGLYCEAMGMLAAALYGPDETHDAEEAQAASEKEAEMSVRMARRFSRRVHVVVSESAPAGVMKAIQTVLKRLVGLLLGSLTLRKYDRAEARKARATYKVDDTDEDDSDDTDEADDSDGTSTTPDPTPQRGPVPRRRRYRHAVPRQLSKSDPYARKLWGQLKKFVKKLREVGLSGSRFQALFAEVMDDCMAQYVQKLFKGRWDLSEREGLPVRVGRLRLLQRWMEHFFMPLTIKVLTKAGATRYKGDVALPVLSPSRQEWWRRAALGRLSALRITELYDMVLHWPASRGGLLDLRYSVQTPEQRAELVSVFVRALSRRLLHPASTTLEMLQVYVAMVQVFHFLDASEVLLMRAVAPLQVYLCQRDDAVRIVVEGLLADPPDSGAALWTVAEKQARARACATLPVPGSAAAMATPKLDELATILNDPAQRLRRHEDDEDLDWDDMAWVPDPVDAGTNYRRPKTEDVIGNLIGALGSRESFTRAFQTTIASRLLSSQASFDKELRVLHLLKKRFGANAMVHCEVMIRDIQDSAALNSAFAAALGLWRRRGTAGDGLQFGAKILSRLYWPGLEVETFVLPRAVAAQQEAFGALYGRAKAGRTLTWLAQAGQATVELALADRTLTVECNTYEAAVIDAFASDDGVPAPRLDLWALVEALRMDEDLVAMALAFWVKQGVLRRVGEAHYTVVERQGEAEAEADGHDMHDAKPATEATAAKNADDAQRTVYWQFIVGMLTNSAASMPLGQIAMMMKMLVAGGFSWTNEVLAEFLGEKVDEGALEFVGGKYKLLK